MKAPAKSVDRPGHNNIKLASSCRFVQGVKLRPLVFALGARDAMVLIDMHDLPSGTFGNLAQFTFLIGGGLVEG